MRIMDFSALSILVLGDVMLDEYVAAQVSRISPEAPVPVAKIRNQWVVPGGAANVARNLARLGCGVTLLGPAGEDAAGETLSGLLQDEGITNGLYFSKQATTSRKTRIVAQNQQMLRLDQEEAVSLLLFSFLAHDTTVP